ncbi:MAG: nucleotidyltransferase family protein [Oscillospiraceae bacterium]|jgi:CTP:molybdopterin cytidylyltransferase MocA|nr:nucleotidyltransferase family protein [Oscillospiraceae bacterium]
MKDKNFYAIILAAGFSSRMGVLKPLLPVGDCPAIVRTVNATLAAGVAPVVVTGYRGDEIKNALDGAGAIVVHNPDFADGMFTSVVAGARALPPDASAFFLLPADCCTIEPRTLSELAAQIVSRETICYPTYGGKRGHPPVIPAALAAGLIAHEPDNTGAKGYFNRFPSVTVEVADAGVLRDMDTPSDYAETLRALGLPTSPTETQARELFAKYGTAPDFAALGFEVLLREGYPDAAILVRDC